MHSKRRTEVLVVGAGPVGLMAALVLAKKGVAVEIIDRDWRTGAHSYALALHGSTLRLLGQAGLLDRILKAGHPVDKLGLYDRTGRKHTLALPSTAAGEAAVLVMPQDSFEYTLEQALAELGVGVCWNHELAELTQSGDRVRAVIHRMAKEPVGYAVAHTEWVVADTRTVEVPLLIGADGHRSMVRRSLGIEFAETAPPEYYSVYEFESSADSQRELRVALNDTTTDAVWPLTSGRYRWSFQAGAMSQAASRRVKDRLSVQLGSSSFPVVAEETLKGLLATRAPWFTEPVGEITWRVGVRFEHRLAARFGAGRVWLAGDAAHLTGPVGMQSMNSGLAEAVELAECYAAVLGGGPLTRMEEYQAQWIDRWRFLLGLTGGFDVGPAADEWIRSRASRLLPCIPAGPDELAATVSALGIAVRLTS